MSRVGPFAAVLFDLDGTLLDSVELIVESYRHTLAAHGLPPRERADVLLGLGQTLEDQFRRWYGEDAPIDALVQTYIAHNRDVHDDWVKPFDGLGAVVERLHNAGVPLAVVTSKRGAGARRGLAALGLTERFEVVVAGDDVARPKPDPEPVRLALRQLGEIGRAHV
jgi:pyrophosphatase PpaX